MQDEGKSMIPEELKKYQKYLLEMLLVFDAFCR